MLQSRLFSIFHNARNLGITTISRNIPVNVKSNSHTGNSKNYATFAETIQYWRFQYFHDIKHHLDNDKWAKIFSIEGNIGVGKHEFGKQFSDILGLSFFPTPSITYEIERQRGRGKSDEYVDSLLDPESAVRQALNVSPDFFFKEPADWIHTGVLRLLMMKNRYLCYNDALGQLLRTGTGVTTVRSYYSDKVLGDAQREMRWLRRDVYDYYDLCHIIGNDKLMHPQVILYLDIPAQLCYERLQAGDNEAEKRLPLEYLKKIEDAYRHTYLPYAKERGVHVIELDWTDPSPLNRIIETLDEIPSLEAANSYWKKTSNGQLKDLLKWCDLDVYRRNRFSNIYTPIDEIAFNRLAQAALHAEHAMNYYKAPKGLNAALGDKYTFFKDM